VLYRERANSLERTLGLTLAALVLWAVANIYPFMTFEFKGQSESNVILSGVIELYSNGAVALSAVILFTSILAPIFYIGGMLYVLVPIRFGWRMRGAIGCFRVLVELRSWSMLEVYLLGVMVAVIKLDQLASIEPGIAMGAFAALILVWSASQASLDPRVVWRALEKQK
jgi:paraquat-inducible protein A